MVRPTCSGFAAFLLVLAALTFTPAPASAQEPLALESTVAASPLVVTGEPIVAAGSISLDHARAQAQAAGVELMPLSLSEAMTLALRNNLDIRVSGYQPRITATEIERQLSQFDPTVSSAFTYSSQRPAPFPVTSTSTAGPVTTTTTTMVRNTSKTTNVSAALSTMATTGANVSLGVADTHNETLSKGIFGVPTTQRADYYSGALQLQVTQPLLRNAGVDFNKSNITIAQNNTRVSSLQFENDVMDLLLSVSNAYWTLVFTREDFRAKEKSLQAAQDFLKNNEIKYEAGALAKIEVTRARASVADRQEAIVLSRAAVKDAEDRLRSILDTPKYEIISTAMLFPIDQPAVYAVDIDLPESVHNALVLRPDLRQQLVNLESLGILIARAKNQLLPEVDLQATYLLNGEGDSWQGGFNEILSFENKGITAGVLFSVPLGNRLARSNVTAARYQRLQALASLASGQRTVTYNVKRAIRDVSTALQSVDTNRIRVQAAQEQLDAEMQKFDVGQSIALDVLDAQDALQQAESGYIAAVVSFNTAVVNYYRQTGLILQQFGVSVSAPDTIKCGKEAETLFP